MAAEPTLGGTNGGYVVKFEISENQIDIFVTGLLDRDNLFGLFEAIRGDDSFHCGLTQFWHFEDVDCSKIDSAFLSALGHGLSEDDDSSYPPVAFIAASDLLYGMCRAYAAWVGSKPIEVGVFRSYDDALSWAYPSEQTQGVA